MTLPPLSINASDFAPGTSLAAMVGKAREADNNPKHRFRAGWRTIGEKVCWFRSRWEANYARLLEFQKQRGEILEWEHEPETFWFEGIKRGVVSYLPDFRITRLDGAKEFIELKGYMDAKSKTKLKRMKKYHPTVIVILVDARSYRAIEKLFKETIPGWE